MAARVEGRGCQAEGMRFVVPVLTAALLLIPMMFLVQRWPWLGRGSNASSAEFVAVGDTEGLDNLFEASNEGPVVLFLHDPYCPISARAHRQVQSAGGLVHLVDVSRQHELNRVIEERTGVRHESPQAFVLRHGRPIWFASHCAIITEGVASARSR